MNHILNHWLQTTDLLPLNIIKSILPNILPSITHIVNVSLSAGIMPDGGNIAKATPILKGGDLETSEFDNYRGISILMVISKCIEFCVNLQTTEYFESNSLLCDNQSLQTIPFR